MQLARAPAPGARALIRDEEWIVQNADMCELGGWQLSCIGISETVRNRRALFLSQLEDVTLIDPATDRVGIRRVAHLHRRAPLHRSAAAAVSAAER
jgi:hypothetical protein